MDEKARELAASSGADISWFEDPEAAVEGARSAGLKDEASEALTAAAARVEALNTIEAQLGTDPTHHDTDRDGLSDYQEVGSVSAPNDQDNDGEHDGHMDGEQHGLSDRYAGAQS